MESLFTSTSTSTLKYLLTLKEKFCKFERAEKGS
jgi:hypothetical protein